MSRRALRGGSAPGPACARGGARAAASAGGAKPPPLTYQGAGVDIAAGAELVERIKAVAPGVGGFGGLYPFGGGYLVAGTDGVGTKLRLAIDAGQHSGVGVDLVAMSVNDVVTSGAKPLFFLDYFATGALDVDVAETVVAGIAEGCRQAGCVLLGGETAEMPGFYSEGDYDLSGCAVAFVSEEGLVDGTGIAEGDALVALPSSGPHSNGFSLARQALERSGLGVRDALPGGAPGETVGGALLEPTRIYVQEVLAASEAGWLKGAVHVTGGGFQENIPRVLPDGLGVEVDCRAWEVPAVFRWLQDVGGIDPMEMFRTFNMGVGVVLFAAPEHVEGLLAANPGAFRLGSVTQEEGVTFKGL